MATVKLEPSGKVVIKDGKVACGCCGPERPFNMGIVAVFVSGQNYRCGFWGTELQVPNDCPSYDELANCQLGTSVTYSETEVVFKSEDEEITLGGGEITTTYSAGEVEVSQGPQGNGRNSSLVSFPCQENEENTFTNPLYASVGEEPNTLWLDASSCANGIFPSETIVELEKLEYPVYVKNLDAEEPLYYNYLKGKRTWIFEYSTESVTEAIASAVTALDAISFPAFPPTVDLSSYVPDSLEVQFEGVELGSGDYITPCDPPNLKGVDKTRAKYAVAHNMPPDCYLKVWIKEASLDLDLFNPEDISSYEESIWIYEFEKNKIPPPCEDFESENPFKPFYSDPHELNPPQDWNPPVKFGTILKAKILKYSFVKNYEPSTVGTGWDEFSTENGFPSS